VLYALQGLRNGTVSVRLSVPHHSSKPTAAGLLLWARHTEGMAVRVAVGMSLGLGLCVPHDCHCGTLVDAQGLHDIARHHVFNDITSFVEPSVLLGSQLSKSRLGGTDKMANIQTGNLNPMARWPFVSLGRYSRQPISCFLR